MYKIEKIDETLPEAVKGFLRKGYTLHEIRLDARGKWTHEGLDFENPRIIDAFNRGVARTEGGTWVLRLGRFTYPIIVDDTGYFVERLQVGADDVVLELSDGTEEPLDLQTVEYADEGRLYCSVKDGAFRARFKKPAYYELAGHMNERDGSVVLEAAGEEVALGSLEELA